MTESGACRLPAAMLPHQPDTFLGLGRGLPKLHSNLRQDQHFVFSFGEGSLILLPLWWEKLLTVWICAENCLPLSDRGTLPAACHGGGGAGADTWDCLLLLRARSPVSGWHMRGERQWSGRRPRGSLSPPPKIGFERLFCPKSSFGHSWIPLLR